MGYRVGYPHTEHRLIVENTLNTKNSPPNMSSAWMGFSVCKIDNVVHLGRHFNNSEVRNESLFKLVQQACERHAVPDFDWILIHTGDHSASSWLRPNLVVSDCIRVDLDGNAYRHLCPATKDNFAETIPDWVYHGWPGTGIEDFETVRLELLNYSEPPETDLLGWRGMDHHENRIRLLQIAQSFHPSDQKMDCMAIGHHGGPAPLSIPGSMALLEQTKRFKYFIDIEGYEGGYSGGLKLKLQAPRLIFIQERIYKEDFFQWLVPFRHYIPVKNNLSDLVQQLEWIKQNPELERNIIREKEIFCRTYLTQDAALKRLADQLYSPAVYGNPRVYVLE